MIKFPFFNSQELNLDWIMLKLKEILKFMPLDGNVGDVLQRKAEGAAWESISAISMDIHSLSSTTPATGDEIPVYDISAQGNRKITVADIQSGITAPVTSVNSKTGAVVLDKTDIGLGNVANVAQYSASNPPPYPVTSVNGQTGDVVVSGTGLNFDLLWTDPHYPETIHQYSFPAQTVALSLSSYKMVMIETVSIMGFQHFDCFPVPTPNAVNQIYYRITNADQKFFVRDLIITNSGINFQAGGYFDSYNGVQQTDNDYVHPCRIWGIK